MSDDFYQDSGSGGGASGTSAGAGAGGDTDTDSESDGMEGATALLPKALCKGKDYKPGDEIVLKVVHDHGDEIEVCCDDEDDDEDSDENDNSPATPQMDAALGSMTPGQ